MTGVEPVTDNRQQASGQKSHPQAKMDDVRQPVSPDPPESLPHEKSRLVVESYYETYLVDYCRCAAGIDRLLFDHYSCAHCHPIETCIVAA